MPLRLLRACVAFAVAAVTAAALAAPVGGASGGAFVALGRDPRGDVRAKEAARHRATLAAALEAARAALAAEAKDAARFEGCANEGEGEGGVGVGGGVEAILVSAAGLRRSSLPAGATGDFFAADETDGDLSLIHI